MGFLKTQLRLLNDLVLAVAGAHSSILLGFQFARNERIEAETCEGLGRNGTSLILRSQVAHFIKATLNEVSSSSHHRWGNRGTER